jgi:DNA-binding PadR family transcriptional regulator
MPAPEPTPDASLTDDMILAAVERAERHRNPKSTPGISLSTLKEHLGLPHHGGTTRRLRPQLKTLETNELIEQYRRNGPDTITLTDKGQRRLDAVRDEITLPEAPQHQAWREARHAASDRIAGFRGDLRGALDEAIALLEADHESDSNTWFEFSERLHHTGRLFASAIHCLREWPEPDDSRIDTDDPPYKQQGRRHVWAWDSTNFPY